MRRLIINADDFGLTAGVNRGIVEAQRAGLVTSATVMATSRAFDSAVAMAIAQPELAVGCHVVLVSGEPLLSPARLPTLTESNGKFRKRLLAFARAALTGRISADEIAAEATAQIRKVQQAGIVVSHLDTHKHAHIFPAVLRPLLAAARACGVRAVRNPSAPSRELPRGGLARRPQLWKRQAQVAILRRFGAGFLRGVAENGMVTTDGTLGIACTGALDLKLFRTIVTNMPEGTWEFVCHPGYNDADLAAIGTRLRASRQRELEMLTSAEARVFLRGQGIELVSYRELAAAVSA